MIIFINYYSYILNFAKIRNIYANMTPQMVYVNKHIHRHIYNIYMQNNIYVQTHTPSDHLYMDNAEYKNIWN